MKVGEATPKPPKVLLYGAPGSGKTALTLTLGERLQILDLDDGITTGQRLQDRLTEDRKKADLKQYLEVDITKRANAFNQIKTYIYGLPDAIAKPPGAPGAFSYKALAIDSLTALGDADSKYIMGNSGKIDGAPQLPHWGLIVNDIQNVMAVLKTLPIVVVLVAHDEGRLQGKITDEDSKTITSIAVPTQKLVARIPRYFDEIWYTRVRSLGGKKLEYYLQTRQAGDVIARSRLGVPDGFVFATTDGEKSLTSVGMWDILKSVGYEPTKETSNASV